MARRSIYTLFMLIVIAGIVAAMMAEAYRVINASNARERGESSGGEICTACGPIR